MDAWLAAALDYLPRWLEMQMRMTAQASFSRDLKRRFES